MATGRLLAGVSALAALAAAGLALAGAVDGRADRARGKPAAAVAPEAPPPPMQVGMNLGSLDYWNSEWPFADLVQGTGVLVVSSLPGWPRLDKPDAPFPLDAAGRPGPVPAGTTLGTILQLGSARLPVGSYDCRVSPGWRIELFAGWELIGSADAPGGRFGMRVPAPDPKDGLVLRTTARRDGARLDELSCRMADAPPAERFNPVFLAQTRPFGVIRFMDWMNTNAAGHRTWATRTTPGSFSQSRPSGVSVEDMVALANRLDADPWFTLPFDADPDYYRRFAEYVRDHLEPGRRAYVELSNEVWNTQFPQAKLAQEQGQKRYPGVAADVAADYYYADRVRDVMDEWTRVFGSERGRIVRVLASQAVWKDRIERTLGHGDVAAHVDALATAPYFGTGGERQAALSGQAKVDAIYAEGPRIVDEAIGWAKMGRAAARRYGLRYISYEGGPGFTTYNTGWQADFRAVEADPRMEALYRQFLRRWKNEVGDLLVVYTDVMTPGGGNLFGHRAYTGQPLAEAPKARALMDAAWGARLDGVPAIGAPAAPPTTSATPSGRPRARPPGSAAPAAAG